MPKTIYPQTELAAAYASGEALDDISQRFGCSYWAIQNAARRAGVPRRRIGGQWKNLPEATLRQIVARYEAGESQRQIGISLGLHQTVVSRILRSRGVQTRGREYARREDNPRWKGGRHVGDGGYIFVRSEEFPSMVLSGGYVREHRLVMARHLGRALLSHEGVHHKNGNRGDNRIENLELRVGGHGSGATHPHCPTCTCFST